PTCKRLEDGYPEAFVERRVRDAERAAVKAGELFVRHEPEERGAFRLHRAPAARAGDAGLDVGAPRGASETREVLARLERADREYVVAVRSLAVRRERLAGRVRNDADARLLDPEDVDDLPLRELADGDHSVRAAHDAGDRHARVRPRPAVERLGM